MNQLKRKLHNSKGASMIIALVFMLICLFVGGSVLVAASMNTNRIRREKADGKTQQYLDQRSAAMLIADELRLAGDKPFQLIIRDETTVEMPVTRNEREKLQYNVSRKKTSFNIEFEAVIPDGVTLTPVQRLAFETAVEKYLKDVEYVPGSALPTFKNFPADFPTKLDNFWSKSEEGSIDIAVTSEVCETANYKAVFRCEDENTTDDFDPEYDFVVGFEKNTPPDQPAEKYSQLEVRLQSAVGYIETPAVEEITMENNDINGKSITTTTKQTTISWTQPIIQKGA